MFGCLSQEWLAGLHIYPADYLNLCIHDYKLQEQEQFLFRNKNSLSEIVKIRLSLTHQKITKSNQFPFIPS